MQQLADFVADAVVATDAAHRVTYWNEAAARLFGWSAGEVFGRDALELFGLQATASLLVDPTGAAAADGRWSAVVTPRTRDGRTLTCEALVAALPDEAGYAIALRDLAERQRLVDDRQKAEERLAATLAFNTKLLDAAPVGILTYRASGPFVSCNAAAAAIVGGSIDHMRQQDFRQLASWRQSGLLALAERALSTREPQASEIEMVTTYGRRVWLLVRLAVFRSDDDDDILLLIIGDITEVKRVEEELRVSQRELRKLSRAIEQSPSSVVITDRQGRIEYVNPSFSTMSGYTADQVRGQNPRIFNSGQTTEAAYAVLWDTITSGGTWRGELCNRSKGGELFWLRSTISPVLDDRGTITHFVAISEHIDAQKAAEAAALESERRFLAAQKMEAIGQLAGGIAHDFNNLLTAILGYSDFVAAAVRHDAALAQDVEQIQKAGERAARLTRQLLAFSRKQRLEPQNINLNQIVDELVKMVGRVIGENIQLDVTVDEALGLAKLDPSQTEQVFMNLVVNARDAMPSGGRLRIRTANVEFDDQFVADHPDARPGAYVAVTVADTGIGMTREVLSRIFEPFFTTKAPGQGTGLGLATVYGIVKQSNGYLTVESEPGAGTAFTVCFPRLSAETVATEVRTRRAIPLRGTETILIAEDEAGLRQVVQRVLERYGYTVLLASNGAEALTVEQHYTAPIDLLLSDIVMPELGGADLAQRLLRRRPSLRILYMSGFERHAAATIGSIAPDAAFLAKPFTPQGLARKIREVLDRAAADPPQGPS